MSTDRAQRDMWLLERLAYWQGRLRLQDWRISASFVRGYDIGNKLADSNTMRWKRHSIIRVAVDPLGETRIEVEALMHDPEVLLVHELLHVAFAAFDGPIEKDSTDDDAEEAVIHALSVALVELDRRGSRPERTTP